MKFIIIYRDASSPFASEKGDSLYFSFWVTVFLIFCTKALSIINDKTISG